MKTFIAFLLFLVLLFFITVGWPYFCLNYLTEILGVYAVYIAAAPFVICFLVVGIYDTHLEFESREAIIEINKRQKKAKTPPRTGSGGSRRPTHQKNPPPRT